MANYELSPCQIEIDGSDMGKTEGGVTLEVTEETAALHTDQDGTTPVDEQVTGTIMRVTGKLAEITLANIATLTKQTRVTDGTKQKVDISTNVGTSLLTNAKVLVLKPYVSGVVTTDANKFITLHQAGIKANLSMVYNRSDQRVLAFEATGYADSTGLIGTFGDTTASA
jgi:hypothetical protein